MPKQIFLLATLLGAALSSSPAIAQPPGPLAHPNVTLPVDRQQGTCPASVGLWWLLLPYEGGGEHTVILNTSPFASATRRVSVTRQTVEFVAPLRSQYATCVGQTRNSFPWYRVQFRNQQAYFRVDLQQTRSPNATITYSTVAATRPFVRWAIAD